MLDPQKNINSPKFGAGAIFVRRHGSAISPVLLTSAQLFLRGSSSVKPCSERFGRLSTQLSSCIIYASAMNYHFCYSRELPMIIQRDLGTVQQQHNRTKGGGDY
ncbi:hypothetical protein AG1IA_03905 [Rhizoctonia solani AG-1 IA]|uniref:Uncharacterized protein n=1 Tax=Thanatephorus cucumeris (strain AG1-IA) TaxID=983506 RepID=L8WZ30_THACA|nr:hypothetical protein AG1IA_03905 [Rhizoctonia solani AG-1 IA]